MIFKKQYKLDLYTPSGDFAGILDVYNLNVELKIGDFSSISFNVAAFIDGEENKRLLDILDLYEVVLKIYNKEYRFILRSIPAAFDEGGPRYTYEGLSIDSELDRKIINGWIGAKREAYFYHKILKEKDNNWDLSKDYSSLYFEIDKGEVNWITQLLVAPADYEKIAEYIEVYEIRESEDIFLKTPLVYIEDSDPLAERGSYNIQKMANSFRINIIGYKETDLFEDESPLMDNDLGIYYHAFLNVPEGFEENDEGLLLIGDAAEKALYEPMETYQEGKQKVEYYTTTGVTLEEVLNDNLKNKTLWEYSIDFNKKTEIEKIKRSDFEFNNISAYQMLKEVAESFDLVFVVDYELEGSIDQRAIKFYKKYEDIEETTVNLITLGEGAYLKAIEKTLDTQEIATNIYGIGKDYISTSLFSPTGPGWADYSYYLDEYWSSMPSINNPNLLEHLFTGTGLLYSEIFTTEKSKWMSSSLGQKLALWQRTRDVVIELLLGNISFSGRSELKGLIPKRDSIIKELTKAETEYIKYKALADKYESLVNHAEKNRSSKENPTEKEKRAEKDYKRFLPLVKLNKTKSQKLKEKVDLLEKDLLDNDSYFLEIREKFEELLDLNEEEKKELQKFTFDYLLQENTVDTHVDLLEKVREYAAENAKPKVTLTVDIIDILAAHNVPEDDKENLFVGNYLFVNFPMFNIDEKVQIKSMSIDFDSNSISLEVSNVESYSKGLLHKMVHNIRDLRAQDRNYNKYNLDKIFETISISEELERKNENEGFFVGGENDPVKVNPEGLTSETAEIDYNLDRLVIIPDSNKVTLSGGTILLEKELKEELEDDLGLYIPGSQVSISVEDGFAIRKVKWYQDDSSIYNEKYIEDIFKIDEDGNIEMTGKITAETGGFIAGWNIGSDSLYKGGVKISSNNSNIENRAFEIKNQENEDEFYVRHDGYLYAKEVDVAGRITARSGQIGGWELTDVDSPALKSGGVVINPDSSVGSNYAIVVAPPGEGVQFSINYAGKMFSKNAEIEGVITANSGKIGNWYINDFQNKRLEGRPSETSNPTVILDPVANSNKNNYAIKVGSDNEFTITHAGKLTAKDANIEGTISADDGDIGGWTIDTNKLYKEVISEGTYVGLHDGTDTEGSVFLVGSPEWDGSYFGVNKKGKVRITGPGEEVTVDELVENTSLEDKKSYFLNYLDGDSLADKNEDWSHWEQTKMLAFGGHLVSDSGSIANWNIFPKGLYKSSGSSRVGLIHNEEVGNDFLGGLIVGRDTIYDESENNKEGIYIGLGKVSDNYEDGDNWEIEYRPVMSLRKNKDFFLWDGRNLELSGNVKAKRGNIGGWTLSGDRLYSGRHNTYVGVHSYDFGGNPSDTPRAAFIAGGTHWNDENTKFVVDYYGNLKAKNVDLTGKIYAEEGKIGGWDIGADGERLEQGNIILNPTKVGDGNESVAFQAGNNFNVTHSGKMTAKKGKIGGWTLEEDRLYKKIEEPQVREHVFLSYEFSNGFISSFDLEREFEQGDFEDLTVKYNDYLIMKKGVIQQDFDYTFMSNQIIFTSVIFSDTIRIDLDNNKVYIENPNMHLIDYDSGIFIFSKTLMGSITRYIGLYSSLEEGAAFLAGDSSWETSEFAVNHKGEVKASNLVLTGGEINLGSGNFIASNDGSITARSIVLGGESEVSEHRVNTHTVQATILGSLERTYAKDLYADSVKIKSTKLEHILGGSLSTESYEITPKLTFSSEGNLHTFTIELTSNKNLLKTEFFNVEVYINNVFYNSYEIVIDEGKNKGKTFFDRLTFDPLAFNLKKINNITVTDGVSFSYSQTIRADSFLGVSNNFNPLESGDYNLGGPSNRWHTVYATTSEINVSDRREKKDIEYNMLKYDSFFDSLKPVSYKFKNGERKHLGLISQDVEESLLENNLTSMDFAGFIKSPNLEKEKGELADEDYSYGLRYSEFIGLLIYQVQELKKEVNKLKKQSALT